MNDNSTVKWIVIAIISGLVLKMLRDMFGPDKVDQAEDEAEAQQELAALRFDTPNGCPELWHPDPFMSAINNGPGGTAARALAAISGRTSAIGGAAASFHNAHGTLNDNEEQAVGAFTGLRNYWEVLSMLGAFRAAYGTTAGAYGVPWLGVAEKAMIVRTIENLRTNIPLS